MAAINNDMCGLDNLIWRCRPGGARACQWWPCPRHMGVAADGGEGPAAELEDCGEATSSWRWPRALAVGAAGGRADGRVGWGRGRSGHGWRRARTRPPPLIAHASGLILRVGKCAPRLDQGGLASRKPAGGEKPQTRPRARPRGAEAPQHPSTRRRGPPRRGSRPGCGRWGRRRSSHRPPRARRPHPEQPGPGAACCRRESGRTARTTEEGGGEGGEVTITINHHYYMK